MTRINCISPRQVYRIWHKFLLAEYREMLRFEKQYAPSGDIDIPESYRLGKGHVNFFRDKGLYLLKRHRQIRFVMHDVGYTANYKLGLNDWPDWAMNDWQPSVDDKLLNVSRLYVRRTR